MGQPTLCFLLSDLASGTGFPFGIPFQWPNPVAESTALVQNWLTLPQKGISQSWEYSTISYYNLRYPASYHPLFWTSFFKWHVFGITLDIKWYPCHWFGKLRILATRQSETADAGRRAERPQCRCYRPWLLPLSSLQLWFLLHKAPACSTQQSYPHRTIVFFFSTILTLFSTPPQPSTLNPQP